MKKRTHSESKKDKRVKGQAVQHYVMTCEGVSPATCIGEAPEVPGAPWMDGQPVSEVPDQPLVFTLDPAYPGKLQAMYEDDILLMREDLVEALKESGVDNVQWFPAILRDTRKRTDHKNYYASNIVGVVACADVSRSRKAAVSDSEMIDAFFDSLVIDESKTGGALMFRLAESVSAIIVHEKVKKHIEQNQVPNMVFYGPGEWAG